MRIERPRPILSIILALTALFGTIFVLASCTKHSSSRAEVVIEDPLFPDDLVPTFWDTKVVFHKEDVLLLPISLLIPNELLLSAPELPTTMQLGPFFVPVLPLEAGLYSDSSEHFVQLFMLDVAPHLDGKHLMASQLHQILPARRNQASWFFGFFCRRNTVSPVKYDPYVGESSIIRSIPTRSQYSALVRFQASSFSQGWSSSNETLYLACSMW